jgi:hypothetical protein
VRPELSPWREVLPPHPDVVAGEAHAGDFAADLQAPGDPVAFFRRTHLTRGLRELLPAAVRRLAADPQAPAVLGLESGFGAGKTHALLALWHAASSTPLTAFPDDLRDLLGGTTAPSDRVRRAALVGTDLPVTGVVHPDVGPVGTAWGELARQLGGPSAFALVAEADAGRTSPAGRLRELFAAHAPCLVLLDEWAAYARQLIGRDDLPAGTFETQLSFVQALTEAARAVPGALVVVSLPADPDVEAGAGEEETLRRLRDVVRRVAEPWRPPGGDDTVAIVRRRLFATPDPGAGERVAATAAAFAELYTRYAADFPAEVSDDPQRFAERIAGCYPLHPELVDRLLGAWAGLPGFQRTRGLLRIVGAVVRELAEAGDTAPLILPGTLPLDRPRTAGELLRLLPDDWQHVIETDVAGPGCAATAAERDTSRPVAAARRLARTVFLGTAAGDGDRDGDGGPGLAPSGIRLGAALPGDAVAGDSVADLATAVDRLARRSTYLHADAERYRYRRTPSPVRLVTEQAQQLRERPDLLWAEVVARLRTRHARPPAGFAAVRIAPDSGADVPDTTDLTLVVVHPALSHRRGDDASAAARFAVDAVHSGVGGPRVRRNRLVFLAADAARVPELAEAAADFLAWDGVRTRALADGAAEVVATGRRRADDALAARIEQAYAWVLVPEQPDPTAPLHLGCERLPGGAGSPADRVAAQLRRAGLLAGTVSAARVRTDLDGPLAAVWRSGHVAFADLWEQYARHVHLTRLPHRQDLAAAVSGVLSDPDWRAGGFALAQGYDPASGRYLGLLLPGQDPGPGGPSVRVDDGTLLVAPDTAQAQEDGGRRAEPQPDAGARTPGQPEGSGTPTGAGTPARGAATQFRARYRAGPGCADPARAGRDLAAIGREIVQLLAAGAGAEVEVTVRVRAGSQDGFGEGVVQAVRENARALRLPSAEFEP